MYIKQAARLVSAIILCGATIGTAAYAGSTSTFTFVGAGDSGTANISLNGGASFEDVYAGEYEGNLGGQNIGIFCVADNHDIWNGTTYQANTDYGITDGAGASNGAYYQGGLASAMNANDLAPNYPLGTTNSEIAADNSQRADEIGYLVNTYYNANANTFVNLGSGSADAQTNMTAVALSIWDIETDGGNGISTGQFVTDSGSQDTYGSLVNFYEGEALAHDTDTFSDVGWIQAPLDDGTQTQSFAYLNPEPQSRFAPVPEASTWLSFASLLAGMGLILRGRSTTKTITAN